MDPLPSPESPDRLKRALDDDDQEHHLDEIERERKRAKESLPHPQGELKSQWNEADDDAEPGRDAVVDSSLDVPHSSMDEDTATPGNPLDEETASQASESVRLSTPPLTTIASGTTTSPQTSTNDPSSKGGNNNRLRSTITMRALVTTREAGLIIGKSGRNVKEIRETAGAAVSVSEPVASAPDRVLSVTGQVDNIAKAFALIAAKMAQDQSHLEGITNQTQEMLAARPIMIRLLVPSARVGPIIGKSGSKIREIQERSGARVFANNESFLPQTTEKIVVVEGVIDAVHIATYDIGTIIAKDQVMINGGVATYNSLPRNHTARPNRNNHHHAPQPLPYFMPFQTPIQSPYVSPATSPHHYSSSRGYSPFSSGMTPPPGSTISSPPALPPNNGAVAPVAFPFPYPVGPMAPGGGPVPILS